MADPKPTAIPAYPPVTPTSDPNVVLDAWGRPLPSIEGQITTAPPPPPDQPTPLPQLPPEIPPDVSAAAAPPTDEDPATAYKRKYHPDLLNMDATGTPAPAPIPVDPAEAYKRKYHPDLLPDTDPNKPPPPGVVPPAPTLKEVQEALTHGMTPEQKYAAVLGRMPTEAELSTAPDTADYKGTTGVSAMGQQIRAGIVAAVKAVPYGNELYDVLMNSPLSGSHSEEQIARLEYEDSKYLQQNPGTALAGSIAGGVLGYGAIGMAMPELFGGGALEAAAAPLRIAASTFGNSLISAVDAYSRGEDPYTAATVGAILGGGGTAVGHAIAHVIKTNAEASITELALDALRENYHLTPVQSVNNPIINLANKAANVVHPDGMVPQATYAHNMNNLYAHVADALGESGTPRITAGTSKEGLATAADRIGKQYDTLLNGANTVPHPNIGHRILRIARDLDHPPDAHSTSTAEEKRAIAKMLKNTALALRPTGGGMPGPLYKHLIQKGSEIDKMIRGKNDVKNHFASRLRHELEDGFNAHQSPERMAALKATDEQYWTKKTLEPLLEKHLDGKFSSQEFAEAVKANHGGDQFIYGGGSKLVRHARYAHQFLKDRPERTGDVNAIWHHLTHHLLSRTIGGGLAVAGSLAAGVPLAGHVLAATAGAVGLPVAQRIAARAINRLGGNVWKNTNRLVSQARLARGTPRPPNLKDDREMAKGLLATLDELLARQMVRREMLRTQRFTPGAFRGGVTHLAPVGAAVRYATPRLPSIAPANWYGAPGGGPISPLPSIPPSGPYVGPGGNNLVRRHRPPQ